MTEECSLYFCNDMESACARMLTTVPVYDLFRFEGGADYQLDNLV